MATRAKFLTTVAATALRRTGPLLLAFGLAVTGCGDGGTGPSERPPAQVAVEVTPDSATLEQGVAMQLTARVTGTSDARVSWTSDNPAVASVDASGRVAAGAPGSAVITVASMADPSARDEARITVVQAAVAAVRVAPAADTLSVGDDLQLAATLLDARDNELSGREITWSSANEAVATVNAAGLVTATGSGTVVITATSEGVGGAAEISVSAPPTQPVVSFTYSGNRTGSYLATGDVPLSASRQPQHGTWAAALPQDDRNTSIAASRATTGTFADVFLIALHDVTTPGTYALDPSCGLDSTTSCAIGQFVFNFDYADSMQDPRPRYLLVSGSVTITRLDGERIQGTFAVDGVRADGTGGAAISLTAGSFDVPVVANTVPVRSLWLLDNFRVTP
jgi:hypothetical protein